VDLGDGNKTVTYRSPLLLGVKEGKKKRREKGEKRRKKQGAPADCFLWCRGAARKRSVGAGGPKGKKEGGGSTNRGRGLFGPFRQKGNRQKDKLSSMEIHPTDRRKKGAARGRGGLVVKSQGKRKKARAKGWLALKGLISGSPFC